MRTTHIFSGEVHKSKWGIYNGDKRRVRFRSILPAFRNAQLVEIFNSFTAICAVPIAIA